MRGRCHAHAFETADDILREDRAHLGTWFRLLIRIRSTAPIYAASRLTRRIAAQDRRLRLVSSCVIGASAAKEADDWALERASDVQRP